MEDLVICSSTDDQILLDDQIDNLIFLILVLVKIWTPIWSSRAIWSSIRLPEHQVAYLVVVDAFTFTLAVGVLVVITLLSCDPTRSPQRKTNKRDNFGPLARTCGVVVKTAVFWRGGPEFESPPGRKVWVSFQSNLKSLNQWGNSLGLLGGCISCNPMRMGGKGHVVECDSEGVCTHRCFTGKINKNQIALPNLHAWGG